MRNARPAARPRSAIALVLPLLLGTLNGGLNAAPTGDTPPAPPPSAAPAVPPVLLGKIAHIRIFGSKNIRADTIQAVLTSKVGALYSPAAAAKDQTAIKDMGVFNGPVALNAAPSPTGGVDLNYTVTENPIVSAIHFTANTPSKEPTIPAGTLLVQMKTRVGQVLNANVLESDLAALFNNQTGYVRKQGYIFDISADINIDPATGVLTIPLVEAHVQSIQITGNSRIKTADILAHMHTKPGDLYNDNALQKDLGAIYEIGGFKEVQNWTFTEPVPGQLTLTIPVVEREAGTVDKLDEKQGKVIPFLYDPVARHPPVIQVSVNGQPPLPFIVDTGTAGLLSLDTLAAARLGLKQQGPTKIGQGYRYTLVPIQGAVFQGKDRANNVPFNITQAQVLDLSILRDVVPGQRVAGIVGLGMLTPVTTRFDFAAKTLTIFAYPHPPLLLPGATVRPLRSTQDGLFTVHVTLTSDAATDAILDTGSDATGVPLAVVDVLHPAAASYGHGVEQIEGLYVCPALRLSGLNLGVLKVPRVVVRALPSDRTSLGMDILGEYRLTLDGPNAQLALEPLVAGQHYVRGWSGIDVRQAGPIWSIRGIRPGSPAGRAGVRGGDEIVTINGRSVRGLSPPQFGRLVTEPAGVPLRVALRRGAGKATPGEIVHASWTPLDEFSAPPDALYGLVLKKANNAPWVVVSVLPGCPGSRAGLRPGDEITRMEGVPVADISLDRLEYLMSRSPEVMAVLVQRADGAAPFPVKLSAPPP